MGIVDEGIEDVVKAWGVKRSPALDFSTATGIVSLDREIGGALPAGAIEIYGPASAGKTSLLYEIVGTAQRAGLAAALCPTEYLDIPYMRVFDIDLNRLLLITGNYGEDVLAGACKFLELHQDVPCILAIDSATSMRPKEDEFGEWNLMVDTFLEVALPFLGRGSCIVMTNQIRTRRSIKPDKFFVDGDIDSAARKIIDRFSTRLELSRTEVTDHTFTMQVNVVANVYSRPASIISLPFVKGSGVDTLRDLIRVARDAGVIVQAGPWYMWGDESLGRGEGEATAILEMNPELARVILDEVQQRA